MTEKLAACYNAIMHKISAVCLETLGCKLNQAESEDIGRNLEGAGFHLVKPTDYFDIYILNSCTVTSTADAKSRHSLRMAYHRNKEAKLVVTGCYAEKARNSLYKLPGVRLVLPNCEKEQIAAALVKIAAKEPSPINLKKNGRHVRIRSFIKIQQGCNRFCAYCIVPFVRGPEISVSTDSIIDEICKRVKLGYSELLLTGTEIGCYNYQALDLSGLIKRILNETKIARLRVSSLQPQEISEELLSLWQNERLVPHFHLSLQSGSDLVLRLMKRPYDRAGFLDAIKRIRTNLPEAAITTDVMVGFPGENEEEFETSYKFCETIGFARTHVFVFSPRPGTQAANMKDHIPNFIKKIYARRMRALGMKSARDYRTRFSGKVLSVLWEKQECEIWSGYTTNYIRVYTESGRELENSITPVRILCPYKDGMMGELNK